MSVEIVPAVLRRTWEGIQEDWATIHTVANHVQIDITDGVFAGDGTFREIRQFKQLPESEKAGLHMMVHNPGHYVDDIIDLNPARCVFHIEAFADGGHIETTYARLREHTSSELGLAINPNSPITWLDEHIAKIDYVLFLGYDPGWAGTPLDEKVFRNIGSFHDKHPSMPIAVDGSVTGNRISPARSACAIVVGSKNQNREWQYSQQQTVSAEGFSGQAFSSVLQAPEYKGKVRKESTLSRLTILAQGRGLFSHTFLNSPLSSLLHLPTQPSWLEYDRFANACPTRKSCQPISHSPPALVSTI